MKKTKTPMIILIIVLFFILSSVLCIILITNTKENSNTFSIETSVVANNTVLCETEMLDINGKYYIPVDILDTFNLTTNIIADSSTAQIQLNKNKSSNLIDAYVFENSSGETYHIRVSEIGVIETVLGGASTWGSDRTVDFTPKKYGVGILTKEQTAELKTMLSSYEDDEDSFDGKRFGGYGFILKFGDVNIQKHLSLNPEKMESNAGRIINMLIENSPFPIKFFNEYNTLYQYDENGHVLPVDSPGIYPQ